MFILSTVALLQRLRYHFICLHRSTGLQEANNTKTRRIRTTNFSNLNQPYMLNGMEVRKVYSFTPYKNSGGAVDRGLITSELQLSRSLLSWIF